MKSAVDTSVTVAAFASWHEQHEPARQTLARGPELVAHVAFETYAVLTRLPPPHRVTGRAAAEFLAANFSRPWLTLSDDASAALLAELADHGIAGGATYDALVAATARAHDAVLVSADVRAAAVYEALGVAVSEL